jgi:hypothetical protein
MYSNAHAEWLSLLPYMDEEELRELLGEGEPHGSARLSWQAVYLLAGVDWPPAILVGVL